MRRWREGEVVERRAAAVEGDEVEGGMRGWGAGGEERGGRVQPEPGSLQAVFPGG